MDYKQALAKIAEQADVVEAIMAHVSNLNSESMNRRHELTKASELIEALKKIAGEETDLVKFTSESKTKADANGAAVADLQAKLDAALIVAATEQRQYLLLKASQLSKADEKALHKLLEAVPTDKIAVDADVKIEGKTLKDYAISQGEFWERALFPTAPTESVPTGGGTPETPANPTSTYLSNQASALAKSLGLK
jgi:VIT1/CCC1 family predicted Fe2+/Mn2+ transporter